MGVSENRLIERLPRAVRRRILALGEPVPLVLAQVVWVRDDAMRHVYFPRSGLIALITQVDTHPGVEVATIGVGDMLGGPLVLRTALSPLHVLVRKPGEALRIGAVAFLREHAHSAALQRMVKQQLLWRLRELAASAACLRFHLIGPRLARWLLVQQDGANAPGFHVTHEFLAYMLGVRRAGITMAAGVLQRSGLIRYRRGEVTVLDRPRLEAAACSCYASNAGAGAAR